MTIYRAVTPPRVREGGGKNIVLSLPVKDGHGNVRKGDDGKPIMVRHVLDATRDYSDRDPGDKELIDARPDLFRAADVEQATAAPGEKRGRKK